MPETYDHIVIGVGGMGSATVHHLARRGRRVLGLEQFDIPHDRGSSHGITRVIRLAYFEHPSYVPLLRRAYELWRELQAKAGEQLLYVNGAVTAGPRDDPIVEGTIESCRLNDLRYEVMDGPELAKRYPGYRLPKDITAVVQPDGGFLLSERCIVASVNAAIEHGATIRARERVVDWSSTSSGVSVRTTRGSYRAGSLVVTAGAWAGHLVPALRGAAFPERQILAWFQPRRPELFTPARFPVFYMRVEEGPYYGFPVFGVPGFKLGRYHHLEQRADPDNLDREPTAQDEKALRDFTDRYFPDASGPVMALKACMFTNTPDEHFVLDVLPDHPHVAVAAGFSGHGFKFCSVVGEVMADLAIDGKSRHDIGLFSLARFPPTAST
jgi:sarcosine oxidase